MNVKGGNFLKADDKNLLRHFCFTYVKSHCSDKKKYCIKLHDKKMQGTSSKTRYFLLNTNVRNTVVVQGKVLVLVQGHNERLALTSSAIY